MNTATRDLPSNAATQSVADQFSGIVEDAEGMQRGIQCSRDFWELLQYESARRGISTLDVYEEEGTAAEAIDWRKVMDTIYIETSIISHATARPSADPIVAILQIQARDWWTIERPKFNIVTSQLVLDEASLGDPSAASDRLKALAGVPLLPTDTRVEAVADELIARSLMPANARLDALHVATAAVGGVQFLLTQNCRHIANAHMLPRVYKTLTDLGYPNLLIYTPAEFLGNP